MLLLVTNQYFWPLVELMFNLVTFVLSRDGYRLGSVVTGGSFWALVSRVAAASNRGQAVVLSAAGFSTSKSRGGGKKFGKWSKFGLRTFFSLTSARCTKSSLPSLSRMQTTELFDETTVNGPTYLNLSFCGSRS